MATTIVSPSPPSPTTAADNIPTATLALPSATPTASSSRSLPKPCWSPDETAALIDAYRDKWYSLRHANHWQEVTDDVASPPKTTVQCRHKMEKLRKRYRAEIQRAAVHGSVRRYASSWAHDPMMHAMEKGPNPSPPSSSGEENESDHKNSSSIERINDLYNYNQGTFPESNRAAASVLRS